jgi:DNA-binding response OmpR family regulator
MMHAKRKKIMVVDDDERHLEAAKEILEDEGYDVIAYRRGGPAEIVIDGETSAIRANRPDLVLLDINMPALSGDSLASLILANEHAKHVPIVFYSSNDEDSLRFSVSKHGVCGYICKGDVAELRKKVLRYLSSPKNAG